MTTTKQYFKVKNGLEFPRQDALTVTDDGGPSIRPSLLLDFAKTKKLDPRITFTRASTATYYDGETTVKAEENLQLDSQNFQFTNSGVTVQLNTTTAPDGTSTADSIFEGTTTGRHVSEWVSGTAIYYPGDYTISVFAKPNGRNIMSIYVGNGSHLLGAYFDILSGTYCFYKQLGTVVTIVGTPSIVSASNGWFRVMLTVNIASTLTVASRGIAISDRATDFGTYLYTSASYTGTGDVGIYAWGAQFEQRSYATLYTPTTTAPITNYIPVLQTAGTNAARFDHDPVTSESKGLLIEESRTNLISYSNDFSNSTWVKSAVTVLSNAAISPEGTQTASCLIANGTASTFQAISRQWSALTSNTYTISAYFKAGTENTAIIATRSNLQWRNNFALFNLSTGTVTSVTDLTSASITNVGNGWYRCSTTFSTPGGYTDFASCTIGFDFNVAAGKTLFVSNIQQEVGAFSTSYIPTPLTYTGRGSTATYKAVDGLIRTAAANVARYEPNISGGSDILLEGSASNLLSYTDTFQPSGGGPVYISFAKDQVAPDGSLTGNRIAVTGSRAFIEYAVSNGALTFSFWIKVLSGSKSMTVILKDNGSDTSRGTTTFTATTAWQRVSVSGTTAGATAGTRIELTNFGVGDVYWGAQLETGLTATSYIPSVETWSGRASTATYYDSTGTIRTAASGQPRYTYNPGLLNAPPRLLVEAASTNTNLHSNGVTGYASITTGNLDQTAPDGSTCYRANAISPSSFSDVTSTRYVQSCYVKKYDWRYVALTWSGTGPNNSDLGGVPPSVSGAIFDFDTGTFTFTGSAVTGRWFSQNVGNGWYRLWISYVNGPTYTGGSLVLWTANSNLDINSKASNQFISWGFQHELGYTPTSYIATTTASVTRAADTYTSVAGSRAADIYSSSQVTRSADAASITGTNFSSFYRNDSQTIYAEYLPITESSGAPVALDNSGVRAFIIYDSMSSLSQNFYKGSSGSNSLGVATTGNPVKVAVGIDITTATGSMNGGTIQTLTQTMIVPNRMCIGSENTNSNISNSTIKKIAYYPKRLSNTELQSITS